MHVEPEDRVFPSGAFKPRNLSLQLELRWWGFPRLLLFLGPLRLVGLRRLLLLDGLGRQRPPKTLLFGVRLGGCRLLGRMRIGGLRDGACGIGPPVVGVAGAKAIVIAQTVV